MIENTTKGNWDAGAGACNGRAIIGVFSKPNTVVAICGDQKAKDEDESIANAFIISAAKEMFSALYAVKKDWCDMEGHLSQPTIILIDEAMKKARG
jgi:hypothetical protein